MKQPTLRTLVSSLVLATIIAVLTTLAVVHRIHAADRSSAEAEWMLRAEDGAENLACYLWRSQAKTGLFLGPGGYFVRTLEDGKGRYILAYPQKPHETGRILYYIDSAGVLHITDRAVVSPDLSRPDLSQPGWAHVPLEAGP